MAEKRIGSIGTRYLAYVIDTVIYCTLTLIMWFIFSDRENAVITHFPSRRIFVLVFMSFSFVLGTVLETTINATIGKKICSLEVASSDNERYKPYFIDTLSRNLLKNIIFCALALFEHVWFISLIVLFICGIIPLFTDGHKAIHDVIAHTMVVRERVAFGKDVITEQPLTSEKNIISAQPGYYIYFSMGMYAGRKFAIGSEATIGKGQGNMIAFPEYADGISINQCRIYYDYEISCMVLQDMGSEHGTFLPQRNIVLMQGQSVPINLGEPVQAGREVFCLIYE